MRRRTDSLPFLFAFLLLACPSWAQDVKQVTPLPGTQPLTITEPLHEMMVSGIDRFALRALQNSPKEREARWHRDYSSPEAYAKSIAENRERFRKIIGAVDERVKDVEIEVITSVGMEQSRLAESNDVEVVPVRWRVLEGVTAEGLMVNPRSQPPKGRVVAIPDADWTPESFAGDPNSSKAATATVIPIRLAQSGFQVLVPTLISRDDTFSGNPDVAMTNQPHREFVYRMAFQMGRHIIGYEVQKVLAAVDAFSTLNRTSGSDVPIGVVGVSEGGLLALYSAALDPRIDAALVSGYFQRRESVWEEPIYRNVWSLLTEFGDAEIAGMIAPRPLVIEACGVPEVSGPPQVKQGRRGGAAPGKIVTATLINAPAEFERAADIYNELHADGAIDFPISDNAVGPPVTELALGRFAKSMGVDLVKTPAASLSWTKNRPSLAGAARQKRQFDELVEFTQELMEHSARKRDKYFPNESRESLEKWAEVVEKERKYVWEEMIGKLPAPTMPPNVRTRKIIDDPAFTAYEVVIDVYPDVIAGGVLLLPTGMKEGEKRPVVVCQHGLEGTPMSTISAEGQGKDYNYYKSFSVQLAKRGFITYAPQNPYIGGDKFRTIQRKSNPMKRSLFSYIIRQHERTLEWLSSLPNVDPQRIGFYGLSYGGKTAVRVPTMLPQYALSICSADFNEWIRKNVSSDDGYSYMFTGEYEMFEWNMGHTANYAELAMLMTPRPFMVERGHADGVAPDEWVAWEYAKVRRHYVQLGLGDRTEIEFFNGPHSINGVGTFAFLHKHLNWPAPSAAAK